MSESWKTRFFRWFMNWHPAYRGTGAKVRYMSADYREVRIDLPLNRRTRNYVGTIFGGSLYAAADPVYMLQLIQILGPDYVVWDKAASVRFLRPGTKRLQGIFRIEEETLAEIYRRIPEEKEMDIELVLDWKDEEGKSYARVYKTLYIADKAHYKAKRAAKT